MMLKRVCAILLGIISLAGAQEDFEVKSVVHPVVAKLAPPKLVGGLSDTAFAVSTTSAKASKHVQLGMAHLNAPWDFEAYRHFCAAAQADPDCLMAYWGITMSLAGRNHEFRRQRKAAIERFNAAIGDKALRDGDILNIDITVILAGWYGDTSRMFYVGTPPVKAQRLTEVTYNCLMRGIEAAEPGNTLGDIGYAIQSYAESCRYSVVRDFTGHGLGQVFHTAPTVLHYGEPNSGMKLEPGMIFTIEPMINAGRAETKILNDGWTAVTRDKSLSAQFEHSIGITDGKAEIFTLSPAGLSVPPHG